MYTQRLLCVFCTVIGFLFGTGALRAADSADAQARMEQRAPALEKLKAKKLIGENNRGYLEARAALLEEYQNLVAVENTDRAIVYQAEAGRKGVRMETVGRDRAREIGEEAKRGTWLQEEDGQWYEK
jgi:uncharacterized protein YdbL (DUF1318 family)